MNDVVDVKERKPVWLALSQFYLDTELQDADFDSITSILMASPYSLDDVKRIDKYEVFPVLQPNLLVVAGEWGYFDSEWLTTRILESLRRRTLIRKMAINVVYGAFRWMHTDYWTRLEAAYNKANNKSY